MFCIDAEPIARDYDSSRGSIVSKINLVDDDRYFKWLPLLLVVSLLCTLNYLSVAQIRAYLTPSQTAIGEITQLIRSENQLFESYSELKAAYYLHGHVDNATHSRLMLSMNQDELAYSEVSHALVSTFVAYDPAFKARIIKKMISPVCPLAAAEGLSDFEIDRCNNGMPMRCWSRG